MSADSETPVARLRREVERELALDDGRSDDA